HAGAAEQPERPPTVPRRPGLPLLGRKRPPGVPPVPRQRHVAVSEERPTRQAARESARRDWLALGVALSLLAILLGSGPAGSIGGQLPHVDGLLFEILVRLAAEAPADATAPARDGAAALAAAGLERLGGAFSAVLSVALVLGTMLALYRARPGRA